MKKSQLRQIIRETITNLNERKNISDPKTFLCCCSQGDYTCTGYDHCGDCCMGAGGGMEVGCLGKGEFLREQRLLTETEEMSDADIVLADEFCTSKYGSVDAPWYYLRGSWNGSSTEGESEIKCTRYPPGPNQMYMHVNWMLSDFYNNPNYGIEIWAPPTPDFDDAWYDEWEGDYGYHPGHGITPDKTIPGKTSNINQKRTRRINEDDLEQWCLCGCDTGADDCVGDSLPNGECDCSCCHDIPVKDKFPKKYRTIPGKTSNLGKAKKTIRETIKHLLLAAGNFRTKKECILDYITNEFGSQGARYTDIIKFAYYLGQPNAVRYSNADRGYYSCAISGRRPFLVCGGKDFLVKGINKEGNERYFALSFVESATSYWKYIGGTHGYM